MRKEDMMRERSRRRLRVLSATAAGLILLAACGSSSADQETTKAPGTGASMDDLYKAAKDKGEKQVVVYGIENDTCYAEFSQAFPGIKVKAQYMVGEMESRLQQEFVSHRQVGDVVRTGDTTLLALSKDKILEPFTPVTAKGLPASIYGPDHSFVAMTKRAGGLAYNTDKIAPADVPKSWADLTDPKFKGKIVMPDPTGPGAGQSTLQELLGIGKTTDDAWLKKLAANKPALIKGVQPASEALKTGEYSLMLGGLDQVTGPPLEKGAPIKFQFPVEGGIPVTVHYSGIVKNSPHPDAAKLLTTWLLSKDGQRCLVEKGNEYPVLTKDVPNPKGIQPLDELKDVSVTHPVDYKELDAEQKSLAQFQKAFGKK